MTSQELIARVRIRDDGELEALLERVAKGHHVTLDELFTSSRQYSRARHAAWHALHETGHWSYTRIALLFGMADHTVVMYGARRHAARVAA